MLQIHCTHRAQVDAIWRMLLHCPDADFQPVEILLDGAPLYAIVRNADGGQAARPPARPVRSCPP